MATATKSTTRKTEAQATGKTEAQVRKERDAADGRTAKAAPKATSTKAAPKATSTKAAPKAAATFASDDARRAAWKTITTPIAKKHAMNSKATGRLNRIVWAVLVSPDDAADAKKIAAAVATLL